MHISSLSIRNFRNFKSAKLRFKKGMNTVIGENGSGKTNLFFALRILIDDSLPRYFKFYQTDFNRKLESWAGHWIIISITFSGLDTSEEAQALAIHASGHMETAKQGSYSVYFRPKYQFRKELYDYSKESEKNEAGLKLLLDNLAIEDYETVYLCRGTADFSKNEFYKQYVGDFDKIEFPDPDDKQELIFGTWLPKEINIYNEFSCTFIKALRDVESDLRSYSSNPLINLLKGKEKSVEIAKQHEILESIDSLNEQISTLDEVMDVKNGIDKSIKDTVGTTYAPNIDIKSELPNEMEKLFQSLKLWVGDPDEDDHKGKISELSLGGANLIYLSLKLLEYENVKTDKVANFLLVEEPEAHVHTHIQKTLFNNLQGNKTQVIISTHSTHISSVSNISRVNILSRGDKEAHIFHPSKGLKQNEVVRIERYLDAVRSNLLFAKGVVLVEGDAEQILIPEMFKKVLGLTLDEIGVSLINIGSTGFENVARIFHPDRVMKNCSILTDGDASIVKLPSDPKQDNKQQAHCRASEESGREREVRLTAFCKDNNYIKPIYSKYTFEVDLLLNNNSHVFVQCLNNIYKQEATIKKSQTALETASVEVAGVEVLRLAEKYGKGWLALLVAEQLVYNTYIPKYILEAIAFAAAHINLASKAKAVLHRLNQTQEDDGNSLQEQAKKFATKDKSHEELVATFIDNFKEDQLTAFLALI
jgi:predicted ATP-dependent endonuclease of OLD family